MLDCRINSEELLKTYPRGPYTTARTHELKHVFEFDFHNRRISESTDLMVKAGTLPTAADHSKLVDPDIFRERCEPYVCASCASLLLPQLAFFCQEHFHPQDYAAATTLTLTDLSLQVHVVRSEGDRYVPSEEHNRRNQAHHAPQRSAPSLCSCRCSFISHALLPPALFPSLTLSSRFFSVTVKDQESLLYVHVQTLGKRPDGEVRAARPFRNQIEKHSVLVQTVQRLGSPSLVFAACMLVGKQTKRKRRQCKKLLTATSR